LPPIAAFEPVSSGRCRESPKWRRPDEDPLAAAMVPMAKGTRASCTTVKPDAVSAKAGAELPTKKQTARKCYRAVVTQGRYKVEFD